MNQAAYIIYALVSILIVIKVGNLCYSNGKIYILSYFPEDANFGNGINKLLRIAYYLLNIGLVIWSLNTMKEITTSIHIIKEIVKRLSYVFLIIGCLHYINIYTVYLIHKHLKKK